jgi:hypothetical protein
VKAKQAICDIGDSWCPNLVHHFFRRISEARWRETVRARSDISTLAMDFSLVFELSRQRTSIKSHELERLTSCALLPAPCSPWQRSRFRVNFAGQKRRRRDPPEGLGDADHHTLKSSEQKSFTGFLIRWSFFFLRPTPQHACRRSFQCR